MVRNYWIEWHLGPSGWWSGSEKTDFGNVVKVEPPSDRVLTCRCDEFLDTVTSKVTDTVTVLWECDDKEKIQSLKNRFGNCPSKLSD